MATMTAKTTAVAPTELLQRGCGAFNAGDFYRAHELWEDAWKQLTGRDRLAIQGLIQIAAGLHHVQGHRVRPAAALLGKGLEKLARNTEGTRVELLGDLPIAQFARDVARFLERLKTAGATPPDPATLRL